MAEHSEALLRAILSAVGRQAFAQEELAEIVQPTTGGIKQLKAYNLCDGSRTQKEIAKQTNFDDGNFSRTVSRWINAGILFRLGEGRDARLLHIYPLTSGKPKKGAKK